MVIPTEEEEPFLSGESSPPSASPEDVTQTVVGTQFDIGNTQESSGTTSKIKRRLYISHFLSTWNSRMFEFGAVLFLANLFPGDLVPASVYALVRAASAIFFAPLIGRFVDRDDRLKVVRYSIIGQRIAVILSCVTLWMIPTFYSFTPPFVKTIWLGILAGLACVEKLCSIMNLIAIERDWVVVIAENSDCGLDLLNSQMRRIDLACKLLGPLVIALIDGKYHLRVAVEVIFGMNILSLLVEYFAIAGVYRMIPALRSRHSPATESNDTSLESRNTPLIRRLSLLCISQTQTMYGALSKYIRHPVFLPSMALSVLYLTVLSFSGQMVSYLASVGLSSSQIGLLRTLSTALEMSATWVAPMAMKQVGPLRAGLWSVNWQLACTTAALGVIWTVQSPMTGALGLVASVILGRVGLWSFDLSVQIIVQEGVASESRGSFSSLEASLQNLFELCSYASTIIFASSDEFRYPVSMSAASVLVASILYTTYVRKNRGHLMHLSRCMDCEAKRKRRGEGRRVDVSLQELP